MTLDQMRNLLKNRLIVHAARRFPWEAVSVAPDRRVTDNDIQDPAQLVFALWIAVNIQAWLLRWRGDQYSALLRLWRFNVEDGGTVDMDILIGGGGRHRQFKVRAAWIGTGEMMRVRIVGWDSRGVEEEVWNRVGVFSVSDRGPCVVTLPEGGRDGRGRPVTRPWRGAAA